MKFLRTLWVAGKVKVKTDTMPKIADRGVLCMFIGYTDDHDGYVYHMWRPKMERINVVWMKQIMFTKEVEKATVEVTNEIGDGEGDEDADTPDVPKSPKAVEDSSSDEGNGHVPANLLGRLRVCLQK
jgi:hypothetical protein